MIHLTKFHESILDPGKTFRSNRKKMPLTKKGQYPFLLATLAGSSMHFATKYFPSSFGPAGRIPFFVWKTMEYLMEEIIRKMNRTRRRDCLEGSSCPQGHEERDLRLPPDFQERRWRNWQPRKPEELVGNSRGGSTPPLRTKL